MADVGRLIITDRDETAKVIQPVRPSRTHAVTLQVGVWRDALYTPDPDGGLNTSELALSRAEAIALRHQLDAALAIGDAHG